jgi:hypothetical protein
MPGNVHIKHPRKNGIAYAGKDGTLRQLIVTGKAGIDDKRLEGTLHYVGVSGGEQKIQAGQIWRCYRPGKDPVWALRFLLQDPLPLAGGGDLTVRGLTSDGTAETSHDTGHFTVVAPHQVAKSIRRRPLAIVITNLGDGDDITDEAADFITGGYLIDADLLTVSLTRDGDHYIVGLDTVFSDPYILQSWFARFLPLPPNRPGVLVENYTLYVEDTSGSSDQRSLIVRG